MYHLDANLHANLKLYAIGRHITLAKAIENLLWLGLRYEHEHPGATNKKESPYIIQIVPRYVREEKEDGEPIDGKH